LVHERAGIESCSVLFWRPIFAFAARALQQGARLYDVVWFNYPPGFIQFLSTAFSLGGFSLPTARIAVFVSSLLTLATIMALGCLLYSAWSGAFAVLLLATAPHFLALSGAAMAEVPAHGLSMLLVLAALCYYRSGKRGWLVVSSLAFAASLWFKPTTLPVGMVPLVAVWLREPTWRRRIGSTCLYGLLTGLFFLAGLLPYGVLGFSHKFLSTYSQSKNVFELDSLENWQQLHDYFWRDKYGLSHLSLLVLSGYGCYRLWHWSRAEAGLLITWLVGVFLALLFHTPLYRHHLIQLLFPIALMAGGGLAAAIVSLRKRRGTRLVLLYLLLTVTVAELAGSLWVDIATLPKYESDYVTVGRQAVEQIKATTEPGEYVITDGLAIPLWANRPVPPELTNVSRMRIKTGELTDQQIIDIARRVKPGAIIFWEKKLDSLDDFVVWVGCHYDLTSRFSKRHRIYQPMDAAVSPADMHRLDVEFDPGIRLFGYSLAVDSIAVGNPVEVTLHWEALSHIKDSYTVFVHLVDEKGDIIGQDDSIPRCGNCPTSVWPPGELIVDVHRFSVTHPGAGGPYRLLVGLYDLSTGKHSVPNQVILVESIR